MVARGDRLPWVRLAAAGLLAAGVLAPAWVAPAYAQTITVTTTAEAPGATGDCTLGEAILAANSHTAVDGCAAGSGHDVIALAAGATYTLTTATAAESAFVISGSVTLQGHGAKLAHDPVLGALRFFTLTISSELTLTAVSLVGGLAQGGAGNDGPGSGDPGATGEDGLGGAINSPGGLIVLDGVTFRANRAAGGAGGAGHSGSTASGGAGGHALGGAIYSLGTVRLRGAGASFVSNQSAGGQGGNGGLLLTSAPGDGGHAYGGAINAAVLDATAATLAADNNLAQGGNAGLGAGTRLGGAAQGGALWLKSAGTIFHASLTHNHAQGGTAGDYLTPIVYMIGGAAYGGALFGPTVTLAFSTVSGNVAQGGVGPQGGAAFAGGLEVFYSTALTSTLILSNTAIGGAAGLDSEGGPGSGGGLLATVGKLSLDRSAVVGNVAQTGDAPGGVVPLSRGGGLETYSYVAITNTTLALNRADRGGGWELQGSYMQLTFQTLTHITIYSNTAAAGGGLEVVATNTPVVTLANSIVAGNAGGNCDGETINLAGANLQSPGSTCGAATIADPRLRPLGDYGGGTLTAALGAGSPALDVGAPAFCPPTDQRGFGRPAGAGCDLGAYERWFDTYLPILRRQ